MNAESMLYVAHLEAERDRLKANLDEAAKAHAADHEAIDPAIAAARARSAELEAALRRAARGCL